MSMSWLFMLLALNPLNGLLKHPPRDFASLLDPAAVLQAMDVATTDDALIAVLASPDNPATPNLYVEKLMAIRLLEKNKSAQALPALVTVAKGLDITLGDAALEAVSAINGKPSPRATGAALLRELARSVPPDAGFVAALDFERDSAATTVRAMVETAQAEIAAKAAANAQANPSAQPDTAATMAQQMKQIVTAMIPQAEQGIANALGRTGNLRVDAALLILPPRLGTQTNEDYLRFVVKGLYDPARIAALLENGGDFQRREAAGHAVYSNHSGKVEICLFDANTCLIVLANKSGEPKAMESLFGMVTAAGKAPPQRSLAEAFDMVTERQARLAVAGTFSPEQKKSFAATLVQNLQPNNLQLEPAAQIAFTGSQTLLDVVQAQAYAASVDTQGHLAVHIVCPDAAAATTLNDSADKLQKALFDMVTKEAGDAPPMLAMVLRNVSKEGSLWKTEIAENTVTMKVDNLLVPIMGMALVGRLQAHPPAPPPSVQPVPPTPSAAPSTTPQ